MRRFSTPSCNLHISNHDRDSITFCLPNKDKVNARLLAAKLPVRIWQEWNMSLVRALYRGAWGLCEGRQVDQCHPRPPDCLMRRVCCGSTPSHAGVFCFNGLIYGIMRAMAVAEFAMCLSFFAVCLQFCHSPNWTSIQSSSTIPDAL